MNAQQVIAKLTAQEIDSTLAPDARRVLRNERMSLQAAVRARTITAKQIADAIDLAAEWGVVL